MFAFFFSFFFIHGYWIPLFNLGHRSNSAYQSLSSEASIYSPSPSTRLKLAEASICYARLAIEKSSPALLDHIICIGYKELSTLLSEVTEGMEMVSKVKITLRDAICNLTRLENSEDRDWLIWARGSYGI